jgi:hypothetical protein
VSARIRRSLAVLLVATNGFTFASDEPRVSVTVKGDGQSCVVQDRSTTCSALPSLLAQDLAISRGAVVSVASVGCGEAAAARARSVANTLKAAGFRNVVVVGFLSEPSTNCAP